MAAEDGETEVTELVNQCVGLSIGTTGNEVFDLGDEEDTRQTPRLVLLGTRLTKRGFNVNAMGRTVINAWRTVMGAQMEVVDDNLFTFEFQHKKDMMRVLEEGPWHFDGQLIALKQVTDRTKLCKEELSSVIMWVQIHKLPLSRITPVTTQKLGSLLGEVKEIDRGSGNGINTLFLRVRVEFEISKPLKGILRVNMGAEKHADIEFRYEKLPNFCYWCGMLDHVDRDCVIGLDANEDTEQLYGDWMRTLPPLDPRGGGSSRKFQNFGGGGRPPAMLRGGGNFGAADHKEQKIREIQLIEHPKNQGTISFDPSNVFTPRKSALPSFPRLTLRLPRR